MAGARRGGAGEAALRLADLAGEWRLVRVIAEAGRGVTGHLEGRSVWRAEAPGLVQDEEGFLRYGAAAPMRATRRYLWREDAEGLRVLFADGREFHRVPAAGAEALHLCPPDRYRVTYDLALPGGFTTVWRVSGPRKDAILTSRFLRA